MNSASAPGTEPIEGIAGEKIPLPPGGSGTAASSPAVQPSKVVSRNGPARRRAAAPTASAGGAKPGTGVP